MKLSSKDDAIGFILNGALLVVAALSILSTYYPSWASWIFLGVCTLSAIALGVAAKVAFGRQPAQQDQETGQEDYPSRQVSGRGSAQSQVDLIKAASALHKSGHEDAYWEIVKRIAEHRMGSKLHYTSADFSITLNIINVYTGSKPQNADKVAEDEKVDFVLRPELGEKPASEHEIN